jgi:predicted nuclease of restriction endonuclease-like RecB superfamily
LRPADASYRVVNGAVVPDWLGPTDHPWLRELLDRAAASAGGTMAALDERLAAPLPRHAPPRRLHMARDVLRGLVSGATAPSEPSPREVREALFLASAELRPGTAWSRDRALALAAERLELAPADVEDALLADLPSERAVVLPDPLPGPAELALRVNSALAACLCARAETLTVRAWGNARDLVRHLRLQRLLFVARRVPDGFELAISGPTTLFRRTTLYGRAYASVLPRLPWCERWSLEARCAVRGGEAVLRLGPGDPVWPAAPPRRFDSALEERFAADLARRHPEWTVVREPAPVDADGAVWFPDFALECSGRRWFVEIVGFWTPEYLTAKLARLARSAGAGWVVCVDERLDCGVGDLPASVRVVPFRRRLPADVVVDRITAPG